MSALSLQLRPNNETLFFIRSECSTTQLLHILLQPGPQYVKAA